MNNKNLFHRRTRGIDDYGTPISAVLPLHGFLQKKNIKKVWEPAPGSGELSRILSSLGYEVHETHTDFFETDPPEGIEIQITNPPYKYKFQWIQRSIDIGIPFALLVPFQSVATKSFKQMFDHTADVSIIALSKRIRFSGSKDPSPFSVCWVTRGLSLEQKFYLI